ncbi:major histocompatibility complex class I-related gene protein-like [Hemicordylus capensis]|uniref:major histocompatibility complex class I-related gene protein-like n=1 Tax=Hemicordylus capensis TaxID=884348 RepID=UPI002304999D|nr:major histocompatibility complex class I-related gene protein-like [Hemicordylus capensis]
MGLLWWQLSVLGVAALLLAHCSGGSSSHSLGLFYTWLSERNQGLPEFMVGQFVDDQPISYYDSSTKRALLRAQWMEKAEKEEAQLWDSESKAMQNFEKIFGRNLAEWQKNPNQSEGLHIWQGKLGCGLREDGQKRGYWRSGYDGRDFISFDTETNTWTVADAAAKKMKRKWDSLLRMTQNMRRYLEGPCTQWLQTLVGYGNDSLLRKERPVVKVTRKATVGGQETLFCQAYGFYPKKINITWRKDGEFWKQGDSSVNPNSDGTYHSRTSIQIDPKDRGLYLCSVEHANLPEPHLIPLEGPVQPPKGTCQKGEFRCANNQCIPRASKCDGWFNCFDHSDESAYANCGRR